MRKGERVVLYAVSLAALALAATGGLPWLGGAPARANASAAEESVEPRIAVVSLMKISDDLMDSDRFKPARTELDETVNKELIRPVLEQLQAVEKKVKESNPEAPEMNGLREEYFKLRGELQAKQREAAQRAEKLVSEQLKQCFDLVRESAAAIAEKRGFNYVVSSMRSDDKFQDGPVQATVRDMLSRPMVVFPKGVDITDDVREDLKL